MSRAGGLGKLVGGREGGGLSEWVSAFLSHVFEDYRSSCLDVCCTFI